MKVSNMELDYLRSIEDSVNMYLKSKAPTPSPNHEMIRTTERCLTHIIPDAKFKVIISCKPSTGVPFVMGVYPDMKELNGKADTLLTFMEEGRTEQFMKEWASIKNWVIEVDQRILTKDNPICLDDGAQFVALLCHEIGHVLGGNALGLIENYARQKKMYSRAERMIFSKSPLIRKFTIPIFVCTSQFRLILRNGNSNVRDEIRADHYIPNEYREAMISYVENHIINSPVQGQMIATKDTFDNDQQVSIAFSKECIRMMKHRRDVLKNSIKAQYDKGSSKYMSDMVADIGKEVMGYDPEEDETNFIHENAAMESIERVIDDCTKQARQLLETTSVTPRDISILRVQVDDISTVDQKLFIVHTIYDYIEALQAQKEKILRKNPESTKATMVQDAQIEELNDILKRVMKVDVSGVGDRYGVFVKYPKGYEG